MADVASGLFALAGFALSGVGRYLWAIRARRVALEDREHAEQREDDAAWVVARRQAHGYFLTVTTSFEDGLHALHLHATRGYGEKPEDLRDREDAAEVALAELELMGGDLSHQRGHAWTTRLNEARALWILTRNEAGFEERWQAKMREVSQARQAYVDAARAEIGTRRTTST